MTPFRLAKSVRSLQRLRRIVAVLTQHGFGHIVDRMNLRRFMPLPRWRRAAQPQELETVSIGSRLVRVCNDLGPAFIKLGQFATTRPDLLPIDIVNDLQTLQDRVEPFETSAALELIRQELGASVDQSYQSFNPQPIASGSIGQVYRAVAQDGADVVVKVKRPGVDQTIRLDLHLLKSLAEMMEHFLPELRVYRPVMLVDELEQTLLRELDFTYEAASTARVRAALADLPHVHIPETRWDLSGPGVLTLGVVKGRNVASVLADTEARLDGKAVAARLADLYLKQFFDVGTFHADPHPGNILVCPPAEVGLIDFGQVGIVSDELAGHMVGILVAAIYRETDLIVAILADMDALGPDTDTRQFARDLRVLEDKYYGQPIGRWDLVSIFHEATAVMRRHDVAIPRDLVLVLKTLTTVMGIVLQLDPEFDLVALFRPRLKHLVKERLSPGRLARSAAVAAWYTLGLLKDAPQQARSALRQLASGQWQLNVHHERLSELMSELDRSSNRISFSVVLAAIIMGSSLVLTADPAVQIFGIPLQWFGVVGYLVAGILGIGLIWAILRSGRLS
ncbi:MAG TPA: AarF/ABC1/UbiB kinase family protein [Phycisphaerae bacterium]|nr:AarF/ABC1/UbiB kinase family protein [Phycisphaerae bacterium]